MSFVVYCMVAWHFIFDWTRYYKQHNLHFLALELDVHAQSKWTIFIFYAHVIWCKKSDRSLYLIISLLSALRSQEVVFMVTANQLITTEKHNLYLICNVTTSPSCSGFRKPVGVCAHYIQLNIHRAGGQPNNHEDCLFLPTTRDTESLGDTFKRLYDHHLKYDGDNQRKPKGAKGQVCLL